MHQKWPVKIGKQIAGLIQHRFARGRTRPRGEIEQGDPGVVAGLGLQLPPAVTPGPSQIDDGFDALAAKRGNSCWSGLIASPHAVINFMLIVPQNS